MWRAQVERSEAGRFSQTTLWEGGDILSYARVVHLWQHDDAFCQFFSAELCRCDFTSLFWETRPVTARSAAEPFAQVVVNAPSLARMRLNRRAFADHFSDELAVTFANLRGDALLVVPCPRSQDLLHYQHLAAFIRGGSQSQHRELWRSVSVALQGVLGDRPRWVSTSGGGVAWLHVRLDTRPKYYSYAPFRSE